MRHGRLPFAQAVGVAPGLEGFVPEILNGFEIQQRVDGAGIGTRCKPILTPYVAGPPFGHDHGEADVQGHSHGDDGGVGPGVTHQQNAGDQADFDQRRDNVERHEAQQEPNARNTPLDVPRQAARAPRQMKTQVQPVEVIKDLQRHPAHGTLCHPTKDHVAQLAEGHGGEP